MNLFDKFISQTEKARKEQSAKQHREMFPGGDDQFHREVTEVHKLLNSTYSKDDVALIYGHASRRFHTTDERTQNRIVDAIMYGIHLPVTKDDANKIFEFLQLKYCNENKRKSISRIAQRLNCSPLQAKNSFMQNLNEQNFSKADIDKSIVHWHNKRSEEADRLNVLLEDTPAALMEQWTIEYRDNHYQSLGHNNEGDWSTYLGDEQLSEETRRIIRQFFIPFNIDVMKFMINQDAISDPFRYVLYENNPLFSRTLKKFQEDSSLKAVGYPDWFYAAFPDVAHWAIKGEGNRLVKTQLGTLSESQVIDLSRNQIREEHLQMVVELYVKTGQTLECRKGNDNDELPF